MSIIVKSSGGADTGIFMEYGETGYPQSVRIVLPSIPENAFRVSSDSLYMNIFQETTAIEINTTSIGKRAFDMVFKKLAKLSKLKIDAESIGEKCLENFALESSNVKVWISKKCTTMGPGILYDTTVSSTRTIYCEATSAGDNWSTSWHGQNFDVSPITYHTVMYGVSEADFDAL